MERGGWVYILATSRGKDGPLYIGSSGDLATRVDQHRAKSVPGFTRTYNITRLVYAEQHASVMDARQREHSMKRWKRAWKIELIEKLNPDWRDLSNEFL